MDTFAKIAFTLAVIAALLLVLPPSFVQNMLSTVGDVPFLHELNWFIPIHQIYAVSVFWLTAIVLYYLISWLLRQLGIVE